MKPVSLADISYEQGLKLLALRKQALDSGHIRRMPPEALANTMPLAGIGASFTKQALDGGSIGSALSQGLKSVTDSDIGRGVTAHWNNLDQSSRNALLSGAAGTGIGALAGLGSGYTSGEGNYLGRALRGGLAGGALGGGLGVAFNPEIATKLYGQGKDALKSLRGNPAETSSQTESKAPGEASASKTTAQRVMDAAPADRGDTINDLQATATSSNPEFVAGGLGAGTVGGTAYGLKKLHGMKSFDPQAMSQHIFNRAGEVAGKGKPSPLNPTVLGQMTGAPSFTAGAHGDLLLKDLASGAVSPQELAEKLNKGGIKPNVFGNAPEAVQRQLKDLVRNEEKGLAALTEASATKGFRNSAGKARSGRIGAALALLGLGGGALSKVIGQYRQNAGERSDAQQTLRDLSASAQNQE
jgi:hypothetical protein